MLQMRTLERIHQTQESCRPHTTWQRSREYERTTPGLQVPACTGCQHAAVAGPTGADLATQATNAAHYCELRPHHSLITRAFEPSQTAGLLDQLTLDGLTTWHFYSSGQ